MWHFWEKLKVFLPAARRGLKRRKGNEGEKGKRRKVKKRSGDTLRQRRYVGSGKRRKNY